MPNLIENGQFLRTVELQKWLSFPSEKLMWQNFRLGREILQDWKSCQHLLTRFKKGLIWAFQNVNKLLTYNRPKAIGFEQS